MKMYRRYADKIYYPSDFEKDKPKTTAIASYRILEDLQKGYLCTMGSVLVSSPLFGSSIIYLPKELVL